MIKYCKQTMDKYNIGICMIIFIIIILPLTIWWVVIENNNYSSVTIQCQVTNITSTQCEHRSINLPSTECLKIYLKSPWAAPYCNNTIPTMQMVVYKMNNNNIEINQILECKLQITNGKNEICSLKFGYYNITNLLLASFITSTLIILLLVAVSSIISRYNNHSSYQTINDGEL